MDHLRDLETDITVSMTALRIEQPIGPFYIASMKASDLCRIAYFDIRQIYNENGIDHYLGIQRVLNSKRVGELQNYVKTVDATFPSAVILAVDERCAHVEEVTCEGHVLPTPIYRLTLRNIAQPADGEDPVLFRQIARVIDGQHRIAGLENFQDSAFDINVAIFVGLDIASQASVFSVVNLAQTKVNPSLVYDLFAYDKARSPEKTAHELAVALDSAPSSPFYKRIKRLGTATEGRDNETLSQATFVRALLPYLTQDVMQDRDIGRRGGKLTAPLKAEAARMIFRIPFVQGKDADIGAVLWAYFGAVAERWPKAWGDNTPGLILNRSTGFQSLMRFLRPGFLSVAKPGDIPTKLQFAEIFARVQLSDDDFNTDLFKPGSSGSAALLQRLLADTGLQAN